MSDAPRSIEGALDEFLATISFPSARIAFLNTAYQPQANTPYLSSAMPALKRTALTLGPDSSVAGGGYLARWEGLYQVAAVWPEAAGRDGCAAMQTQILRLFKRGTTLGCSDGLSVVLDAPTALPIRPDNAWVRGPVQIPWYVLESN